MKPEDKEGFVFKQKFLLRLVYITGLFIFLMVILKFLIPINYTTVSIFASCIVGTVIGTYVATFVLRSGKVLEEKGDSLSDMVSNTLEKGRDIIEDMRSEDEAEAKLDPADEPVKEDEVEGEEDKKSARERLKDKGYLK